MLFNTHNDEAEAKRLFAQVWAENPDFPLKAAFAVFPAGEDYAKASSIAQRWPHDNEVLTLKRQLIEQAGGELNMLPAKAEFARTLWHSLKDPTISPSDRVKFAQLFGETMGYVKGKNGSAESPVKNIEPASDEELNDFINRFN